MENEMVILEVGPVYTEQISGLAVSIPNKVRAIHDMDIEIALLTTSKKGLYTIKQPYPVFYIKSKKIKMKISDLPNPFNKPDLVIFNSTYIPAHAILAKEAEKKGIPYIITPRGGMNIAAQNKKRIKKVIGNKLFYERMVRKADAIHCLTKSEEQELKGWSYKKSFVVGNGINPRRNIISNLSVIGSTNVVFLSRKDVHTKGIDLLLKACTKIQDLIRKENILVQLYGPGGHADNKYINEYIKSFNINDIVVSLPSVQGKEKNNVLENADLFILTSRHEGHSMAVLEALSYGIPCILSTGTNISEEVSVRNAGWEVKLNIDDIAMGLTKAIQDRSEWGQMGENAKRYVESSFEWPIIAKKLISEYRDIRFKF